MKAGPRSRPVRRVHPAVPPRRENVITTARRDEALAALAELAGAAAYLDNADLFHRPRVRWAIHPRHVAELSPAELSARIAAAAEARTAAGLIAVASVRAEGAERPGAERRRCFDPDSLAQLHTLLAAADPNIPGNGGLRRTAAHVTWADGRRFAIAVPGGPALRAHLDRWFAWATTTSAPPLDAAALSMVWLMTIHPFADGNGRTARLLAQCDLVGSGLLAGLLLDLDGWAQTHRTAFNSAVVAAAGGDARCWADLFAQMVTDTAMHRTASVRAYRATLEAAIDRVRDDRAATLILRSFRQAPAVSLDGLAGRIGVDPAPALGRLAADATPVPHPRLPGAWIVPQLMAILDDPYPAAAHQDG